MKKRFLCIMLLLVNTEHPLDISYKTQTQLCGVDLQDTGDKLYYRYYVTNNHINLSYL